MHDRSTMTRGSRGRIRWQTRGASRSVGELDMLPVVLQGDLYGRLLILVRGRSSRCLAA